MDYGQIDPWDGEPDSWDGAGLLDAVRHLVRRFVVPPSDHALDAVVLWCAATHAVEHFEHATRLAVHSPEKRCGKSRLLEVVEALSHHPVATTNASVAALFRMIDAAGERPPTLVLDEADRLFGTKKADDDNRDLIGLINNGFRPGKETWRCVGPQQVATPFRNFAFLAVAGIGRLPDTIEDRAINLTMRRRLPGEHVEKFRLRTDLPAVHAVRGQLAEWVEMVGERLAEPVESIPVELEDRAQDAWEPLLAVADAAGGHWPATARKAAVELAAEQAEDDGEQSLNLRLLSDVRDAFEDDGGEFLATADLIARLRGLEESPWESFDLTAHKLAYRMSAWKVKPSPNKARTARGWHLNHLSDVFQRYLPSRPSRPSETPSDLHKRLDASKSLDTPDRPAEIDRPDKTAGQSDIGHSGRSGHSPRQDGHPWAAEFNQFVAEQEAGR